MSDYNFQRLDKCSDTSDLKSIRHAYDSCHCMMITEWIHNIYNIFQPLAITSGLYRWSKRTINDWPLLLWVLGDPMITERLLILSRVFFAEAALYKTFQTKAEERMSIIQTSLLKSTTFEDLSLVWIVYAVGVIFAIFICFLEIALKYFYAHAQTKSRYRGRK